MDQKAPPIPQTNPPHEIYAYIIARPNRMLMGVAVDTRTGKNLEAVILPTKQRVMLALGIGDDSAHAHHKYRQATHNNYTLTWTDNPESEEAIQAMSERLKRVSRGVQKALAHPMPPSPVKDSRRPAPEPEEPAGADTDIHDERGPGVPSVQDAKFDKSSEEITKELLSRKKKVEGFF